ncbi:MAG: hypothetical protein KF826_09500 [Xanthobacteraceae bacterium]|nr:hypothetical protein [Xanthobacteraceae bacterium]
MSFDQGGGGKLPGKTLYAGRRRDMTRSSGFSVHPDTTGGEFKRQAIKTYKLKPGEIVKVSFSLEGHAANDLLGYGMWFWHTPTVERSLVGGPEKRSLTDYADDSWNKVGSIWKAPNSMPVEIVLTLTATTSAEVALYEPICGRVRHKYLDDAREALMRNMFEFAPEAIFLDGEIKAAVNIIAPEQAEIGEQSLIVKSCNRCGRFLPVNVPMERNQLSFTNHCVAEHRRPCKHATFGRLRNVDDRSDILQLDYGFQLECRFCKKFEVNAAHNPQRSSAQMKEDGARRRAFELLLAELYKGTPQLRYRHENHSELADDIWEMFDRRCFNCGTELKSARDMNLDHTRPLAFLWPLDGSATALCKSCNSLKRDRSPSEFYTKDKIEQLSSITKIPLEDLNSDRANETAIDLLLNRLDWFFDDFLARDEMTKERDGKITGELVVKALQRVFARSPRHRNIDLQAEYDRRRIRKK